jgi:hypothetical protein
MLATIGELLEAVFSVGSALMLYTGNRIKAFRI